MVIQNKKYARNKMNKFDYQHLIKSPIAIFEFQMKQSVKCLR